jgi:hypothetical protein
MDSKNLFNLFNLVKDIDYVKEPYVWEHGPDTGFAILKKYPMTEKYFPAKNINGEDDNLALIKVFIQNKPHLLNDCKLIGVTVSNTSFYRLDNHMEMGSATILFGSTDFS